MILRNNAVLVILLAAAVGPLHSQVGNTALPAGCPAATGKTVPINLCELVKTMPPAMALPAVGIKMRMHSLHRQKTFQLPEHKEYEVSASCKEQIVWTCTDSKGANPQNFQILKIENVTVENVLGTSNPADRVIASPPSVPDFPFCPKLDPALYVPRAAGTRLSSGPPVAAAAKQTYKFSFIAGGYLASPDAPEAIDKKNCNDSTARRLKTECRNGKDRKGQPCVLVCGTEVDPHIVVTGGDPGVPKGGHDPCAPPDDNHGKNGKAKTPAKSKN